MGNGPFPIRWFEMLNECGFNVDDYDYETGRMVIHDLDCEDGKQRFELVVTKL